SGDVRVAIDVQSTINHIMIYTNTTITPTTAAEAKAAVSPKIAKKREVKVLASTTTSAGGARAGVGAPAITTPVVIAASVGALAVAAIAAADPQADGQAGAGTAA